MRVGRYNAAGSSRSLRRTATRAGVGTTAAVSALHDQSSVVKGRLDMPCAAELRPWVEALECWWCKDGRVFKSLSGHWAKGHGMELQPIRDILGVQKRHSFISEGTQSLFSERGRKYYNAANLVPKPGQRRSLSAFGYAAQKVKAQKIKRSKPCVVCEAPIFTRASGHRPKTCSSKCHREQRRRVSVAMRARPLDKLRASANARAQYRAGKLKIGAFSGGMKESA